MDKPRLKASHHELGIDAEKAYLIPLADLHIGAGFNTKKFLGYREWILNEEHAYTVIVGDIIDNSISESIGDTYGTLRPDEQMELAEELLRPLAQAGRILGWVEGNHEWRTVRKTDTFPGKTICKILQLDTDKIYDPDGLYLFLSLGWDRKYNIRSRNTYTLFMLHGFSGGKTIGGKANSLEHMAKGVQADLYIAAHAHQKIMFPSYMVLPETRTKTLRFMKRSHVMAGSFQDWDGYGIRNGYSPTPEGSPRCRLDGTRHDLHVSI